MENSASVAITEEHLEGATCYRRVTFEGKNAFRTWDLTLFLSPDQRFLSSDVFDTTLDPVEEERRNNKALMSDLTQNKGSSKGPVDAPVTIVEFSDFECPYCRKFADIVKQLTPGENDNIRIVYHHLPLQMHPWARTAAEGAACAQLQNSNAFWSMHDQLFEHQPSITRENIHQELLDFAKSMKWLNFQEFQSCLDNQMSLGLVLRDLNLASANNINGTPTLFINGQRVEGIKDITELRQIIAVQRHEVAGNGHGVSASSSRSALQERRVEDALQP
ncbi:MAG TPA: thioredoxin domain-containing protein [Bryobacteraceae bacterium]|nr:thioredoxin domain-containing protein [Bryobacteraceae bacterium]